MPIERIDSRIYLIRGQKVLLDSDLAELYGVETRILNRAVTRNLERFPEDFMFTLTREEIVRISQFGTSSVNLKFSKTISVFTEQGVAMLSGVLRSPQAVQVNIEIMRAFVRLRQLIASSADLSRKLRALEKKYDDQFKIVFEAIRELMSPIDEDDKAREIGFHTLAKSAPSKTKKS
ncbi:DNA-binding protein [Nibricoccus aquaticus]|uniref:DNA-binding protein n=1 Tax=Nibricoccus aquaticus TaxID=2576891 RepID=A0A290QC46_9BACT|nr:DNA-binding protein [Nibricoccus aquaticus]